MWSYIWFRDKNFVIQVHMRSLGMVSLHRADTNWITRAWRCAKEVEPWTCACGIYRRSVWLSLSQWSCLQRTFWESLSRALLTVFKSAHFQSSQNSLSLGPYSSFSIQSIIRARCHILQELNLKSLPLKFSAQCSQRIIRETLFTFLTIEDTTN